MRWVSAGVSQGLRFKWQTFGKFSLNVLECSDTQANWLECLLHQDRTMALVKGLDYIDYVDYVDYEIP